MKYRTLSLAYLLTLLLLFVSCRSGQDSKDRVLLNISQARELLKEEKYEEAVQLYYTSLDLLDDDANNLDLRSEIYSDLGRLYKSQGLYENALDMYLQKYEIASSIGSCDDLAYELRNIALINLYLERTDSCYYYLQEAYTYANQSDDTLALYDLLNNDLGFYYNKIERYDEALRYFNQIRVPSEETFSNKGFVYMRLHQFDSARYNLLRATDSDQLHIKASAYCSLAELEGEQQNYQMAYYYQNNYQTTLDSIQSHLHKEEINDLIHQNRLEKNAVRLSMQYRQRMYFLVTSFLLIVVVAVFLFILNNRKKRIKQQEQENELLRKENEILELNELHYRNFKEKPIYKRILELEESKEILTFKEQEILKNEINFYFQLPIKDLQSACPSLKDDDILLCCLTKLNLSSSAIMLCMGYTGTNTIRQRRYRIKKKMTQDYDCKELYESIFGLM